MKFRVTMKTPDALECAIKSELEYMEPPEEYADDEKECYKEDQEQIALSVAKKWFEYGEYITVEIDTETKTCIVVEK